MKQLLLLFLAASLLTAAAGRANAQVQRQNDNLTIFFTSDVQGKVTSCGCPILDLGGVTTARPSWTPCGAPGGSS